MPAEGARAAPEVPLTESPPAQATRDGAERFESQRPDHVKPEPPQLETPQPETPDSAGHAGGTPVSTEPRFLDLPGDQATERHRLSPRVVSYWRWRALFSAIPLLLLLAALASVIAFGPWWVRWGIVVIAAAVASVALVILPPIRYRVFWYAISAREVDIQHGIIFIKRSVVPMHRVQGLRTERGPVADRYRMTNLKIRTAAGSVTVYGLDRREADDLCDRISELADVADDV